MVGLLDGLEGKGLLARELLAGLSSAEARQLRALLARVVALPLRLLDCVRRVFVIALFLPLNRPWMRRIAVERRRLTTAS